MKKTIFAFAMLAATFAQAKDLKVSCTTDKGQKVKLEAQIASANSKPNITSLEAGGYDEEARDASSLPIYKNGTFTLNVQFGDRYYSSVNVVVRDCSDSFTATGSGILKSYVGGFAGTTHDRMNCTCSVH